MNSCVQRIWRNNSGALIPLHEKQDILLNKKWMEIGMSNLHVA